MGGASMITRIQRMDDCSEADQQQESLSALSTVDQEISWSHVGTGSFSKIQQLIKLAMQESSALQMSNPKDETRKALIQSLRGIHMACHAVDEILSGKTKRAVCGQRKEENSQNEFGGNTVFGNAAIAAHYALGKKLISKVAIIDFDQDHSNETKELVINHSNILLLSVGTGKRNQEGVFRESGNIRTVNLPQMCHEKDITEIFHKQISMPIEDFRPDILFLALRSSSIKQNWPPSITVEFISKNVLEIAENWARGRVIIVFEGGVDEDILEKMTSSF